MRYVYERHPSFQIFPTFFLTLYFSAESESNGYNRIRPFPPASMSLGNDEGIIPAMFLKNAHDVQEIKQLPILHISQSLHFHNQLRLSSNQSDVMVQIDLRTKITSVRPRKIGTFVVTETKYYQNKSCVATACMTALVFGLSPEKVIPWQRPENTTPSKEFATKSGTITNKTTHEFAIPSNAALLYRLSGDYNPIHVDGTDVGNDSDRGPILHGLCTLGYATRAIIKHVKIFCKRDVRLTSISCNFVKPVFVGDGICVDVWNIDAEDKELKIRFCVFRSREEKVVEKGFARLVPNETTSTSRL